MSSESKAFASLSSGLLARKGAARPAMKPQGFGQMLGGLDDLGWNDMGFEPPKPTVVEVRDEDHDAFGEAVPEPALRNPVAALTPAPSPVHDQQAELEDRFAGYDRDAGEEEEADETAELYEPVAEVAAPAPEAPAEPVAAVVRLPQPAAAPAKVPTPRTAAGARGKAAFTLRLDPDRHLKLRLACAVTGRSAQQLVTAALDTLLETMPEIAELAGRAPGAAQRANRKG